MEILTALVALFFASVGMVAALSVAASLLMARKWWRATNGELDRMNKATPRPGADMID